MPTPHISAPDGAFAKTVLMPGDPLRAKLLADTFLENVELVTSVRNVFGYTGTYKGKPVSVMASGMGMPSIGIYSHELYTCYGVENIIRIGSAGSYSPDLHVKDIVLADSAFSESSYASVHNGETSNILYPTPHLNEVILKAAEETGVACHLGRVHSSDVFYGGPNAPVWQELRKQTGSDCVEMESFALFHNANVLGKGAACLLTISDSFVTGEALNAEDRQKSFMEMLQLALEAAVRM